jgi:hypothetical protein
MKQCVVLCALLATQLSAQAPTGRLRISIETVDGSSAAGAIVALVDSHNSVVAEGIAKTDGSRVLDAPYGSYQVRVLRIGYRPFISQTVTIPKDTELRLRLDAPRIVLSSMLVKAATPCSRIEQDPETTGLVWAEVSKALKASQLTEADVAILSTSRVYRRELDGNGALISADTITVPVGSSRPFSARDPAVLAQHGYVHGDETNGWEFFGPDEAILLSREFASTHCFRLVRNRSRPGHIGIAFEPAPGRKIADISGTAWVDQSTSELQEIVFRYVNAGLPSEFKASGFTHFRRMPSGSWIVDDWQLRMPQIGIRIANRGSIQIFESRQYFLNGYVEAGGGVVLSDSPATLPIRR